jgi:hypothetical protein
MSRDALRPRGHQSLRVANPTSDKVEMNWRVMSRLLPAYSSRSSYTFSV